MARNSSGDSRNESNIVKFNKPSTPKVGIMIFAVIFIYMIVNIILYAQKDHLAIFEVQPEDLSDDYSFSGIIVRDEVLCYLENSGYISTYVADGYRVAKGSPVYGVSKNVGDTMTKDNLVTLDLSSIVELKNSVYDSHDSFSLNYYDMIKQYKSELRSKYADLIEIKKYKKILKENKGNADVDIFVSAIAGIVSFSCDDYLGLSAEDITADTFAARKSKIRYLRSNDKLSAGAPIYRLVKSDRFEIVMLVDEKYYLENLETKELNVSINNDNDVFSVPVSFKMDKGSYFAILSFDSYMARYLNDRFVSVSVIGKQTEGLKIPVSSITTKEFYVIPNEYIQTEGDETSSYIYIQSTDSSGNMSIVKNELTIYYDDGEKSYIDGSLLKAGAYITEKNGENPYRITNIERLEGVYNVSKGYAVFRRIERIKENDEYVIIRNDTKYGVSKYNHIALSTDTVTEDAIIY